MSKRRPSTPLLSATKFGQRRGAEERAVGDESKPGREKGHGGIMKREDFIKKLAVYAAYLNQFLGDEDVPKILETIRDLEELRKQAETGGIQGVDLPRRDCQTSTKD